jgi:hypothetical protein
MGEWSSTFLDLGIITGEGAPDTHEIGGWEGPRFGMDAVEKRKIFHCRESNSGRPVRSLSLYRLRINWEKSRAVRCP